MPKNRLNNRGLTLAEILIVMAIILTLTSVLWVVVGPRVLVASRKAAITGDLKQASVSLGNYRADYDDAFPGDWDDFGYAKKNSPENIEKGGDPILPAPPQYPSSWQTDAGGGELKLTYLYNSGVQRLVRGYIPKYPFDEHLYPIFSADFFQRVVKQNGKISMFAPPKMRVYSSPGPEQEKLACFTDGHVSWRPTLEIWQLEYVYRTQYGNQ